MEDFKEYSNIAFVNGGLDPWVVGCVKKQVNPDLPVLTVKNGAHHSESFFPLPTDLQDEGSVSDVRAQIESYLDKWMGRYINEFKTLKGGLMQKQ